MDEEDDDEDDDGNDEEEDNDKDKDDDARNATERTFIPCGPASPGEPVCPVGPWVKQ